MRSLLLHLSIMVSIVAYGCQMKQEAAPSNATSVEVWSTLNGTDCFWTGKTKHGDDLIFRFSNHNGQWYAMANRGSTHFFPTDVIVNEQEAMLTIASSAKAGVGGIGDVLIEMAADAVVNTARAKKQSVCLRLQSDRQSASLWMRYEQQDEWVFKGITLTRSIVAAR